MEKIPLRFIGGLLVAIGPFIATAVDAMPSYQTLYSFTDANGDGSYPNAPLLQSGSSFFGTTQLGGIGNQNGTIFKFDSINQTEPVIYDFTSGTTDGQRPAGSVIQSGNLLYGMTFTGGTYGGGTIYAYDTTANSEAPLYSFGGYMGDGYNPAGSLIQSGTTLYGVTGSGGANSTGGNDGTIFQFDTSTSTEKVLYSFTNSFTDGIEPVGGLVKSGSVLYGITSQGAGSAGTLFQFDLATSTEKILHFFNGPTDGSEPDGPLILDGSALYGITLAGGADGDGAIFKYDLSTGKESILYSFTGGSTDGKSPQGALVQSGSVLYGMTSQGGMFSDGTIFAFDLNSAGESLLYSYSQDSLPDGSLIVSGNTLYGTTRAGGDGGENNGTIFSLVVPEPSSLMIAAACFALLLRRHPRQRGETAGILPGI